MRLTVFCVGFLFGIYPFLILNAVEGHAGYFRFFAADAFYYFNIAQTSISSGYFSFDGEYATNGFHPLWQYLLTILANVVESKELFVKIVFWVCSVFIALSSGLLSAAFYTISKRPYMSIFFSVPGAMGILAATVNFNYGAIWAFANGMETSILVFLFSLLLLYIVSSQYFAQPTTKGSFVIAVLSTLAILSRLDDIFLLIAILVSMYFFFQSHRHRIKHILIVCSFAAISISAYLLYNYSYSGMFLPVSGQLKSGIALVPNLLKIANTIFPLHEITTEGNPFWPELAWRVIFLCLPPITAVAWLFYSNKVSTNIKLPFNHQAVLLTLSIYVILKSIYNITFVPIWHQGHWYYALSIITFNLILLLSISHFFSSEIEKVESKTTSSTRAKWLYFSLILVFFTCGVILTAINKKLLIGAFFILFSLLFLYITFYRQQLEKAHFSLNILLLISLMFFSNAFTMHKIRNNYNEQYIKLWENSPNLIQDLKNLDSDIRLLSFDDGIVAYTLGLPTLSGLGFALDKEAAIYKKKGLLLDIAKKRNYSFLTSLNYLSNQDVHVGEAVFLDEKPFWLSKEEYKSYSFKLAYKDKTTGFQIISFKKID